MLKNELKEYLKLNIFDIVWKENRINPIIGIYKITYKNKINIGQSTDIETRFCHYKKLKCTGQTLLYRALKKYGVKNFTFEIIHRVERRVLSKKELRKGLNKLETHYVKVYNSFVKYNKKNGLNLTSGGDCYEISDETKDKISKSLTGRKPNLSEEDRLKKSIAMSGENNPMFGKFGEQHNMYGKKNSQETIDKRVKSNTGKKMSKESVQKGVETRKRNREEKIKNGYMPRSEIRKRKREEKLKDGYVPKKIIVSEKTKKKQSEAKKGKKLKPESIIKREATRKKNREEKLRLGIVPKKQFFSLETRKKLSESNKGKNVGKKHSEEQNRNHSETMTGRKQSKKTVDKRIETRKRNKQERLTMIF